jgi:hypothetical protein
MNQPDDNRSAADRPLDDIDHQILDEICEVFELADPMPADLPDQILFSLALRDLEVEVARLSVQEDEGMVLAARGEEQSRMVTFDSDSLTIMIRIDSNEDGTARVDGWLTPPQCREIELTTTGEPLQSHSDAKGRFAFARVPRGSTQLTVRPGRPAGEGAGRSVVTPALIL